MATVRWAGRSGFRIPVAARIFSLENIHTTAVGPPSLGMATVRRAGRSGFRIPVAARIFSLENFHTTVGAPPSLLFNG
jgi:hypothetical protein